MGQFAMVLFVLLGAFDIMAVLLFGTKIPEFNNLNTGFLATTK
jgi:hypothetical protein